MSEKLDIRNLKGGAIIEQFNDCLNHEVLRNILSPNTEWKKVRKLTLELAILPNEDRDFGELNFSINPKLAPERFGTTKINMGINHHGEVIAAEWQNPQLQFNFDEDDGKVIPIREAKNA